MYSNYFGLREPSFSIAPDPQYLFLSEQHREALAHLLYGASEHGGFVLLTGEVGTGKTTVCRAFLEQLPEGVDLALIINPAMTAEELLLAVCDEFRIAVPAGEPSVKRLIDCLNDYLLAAHAAGRRPVLMIDEAQNLRPEVMEQVRLLTNLETTKAKLLQIFLIGQPELRRMLARASLRQLDQRITARFHLRPLTAAETAAYIRHRVAVAGVERPLFTPAAVRRIHGASGGVPRLINILCDRALLGACVDRASQVTPAVVARAAREVRGAGAQTAPPPAVRPAFAAAAALALVLTAGWLGWERLGGAVQDRFAATAAGTPARGGRVDRVAAPAAPTAEPAVIAVRQQGGAVEGPPALPVTAVPSRPALAPMALSEAAAPPAAVAAPESRALSVAATAAGTAVPVVVAVSAAGPVSGGAAAPAPAPLPRIALVGAAPSPAATLAAAALPEEAALRVLLRRWGIDIQDLGSGEPCGRVAVFGLRCEREQGRLSHVRYYDLPVLLRLRDPGGARRYAVLGALDETAATLDLADGSAAVPLPALEAGWTGDYTVVWQPPPTGASEIGPGAAEESVRWLRRLLCEVPGSGFTDNGLGRFDAVLGAGVRRFQANRGLVADGIAGPRTLVQLQNAVAMPGVPHLMSPALAAVAAAQAAARPIVGDGTTEDQTAVAAGPAGP